MACTWPTLRIAMGYKWGLYSCILGLTVKNESPGPKTIDGRMIVEVGSVLRNASSALAFVLWLRGVRTQSGLIFGSSTH
jgi:hypothetical protein